MCFSLKNKYNKWLKKLFKLKQKTKKLIGTIIIPVWLILFLGIISSLGEILLPETLIENGFKYEGILAEI